MTTNEIRDALRTLERRGAIQHWTEHRPGSFLVTVGPGPTMKVRNQRDMDALAGILLPQGSGALSFSTCPECGKDRVTLYRNRWAGGNASTGRDPMRFIPGQLEVCAQCQYGRASGDQGGQVRRHTAERDLRHAWMAHNEHFASPPRWRRWLAVGALTFMVAALWLLVIQLAINAAADPLR